MNYLWAFLLAGITCSIAQIILDNSKLTPGHITSIFTAIGALLSFLGIYDKLIEKCGGGATSLISNFGHSLYTSALEGYYQDGFIGIFTNMLSKPSAVITATIIFAFLVSLICKPKD